MNWIKHLRVKNKLLLLIGVAIACIVALQSVTLISLKEHLLENRMAKIQNIVESATGVLEYYYQQEKSGKMSREEAQNSAQNAIKAMRYDGEQYLWINDMHPNMIMHPFNPRLDGTDISEVADPNGVKLFTEMARTVRKSGSGFVNYQWEKPNESQPVDKITFVKGFTPWNWVLGTGVYVDDIETTFMKNMLESAVLMAIGLVIMLGVSWIITISITRPVSNLNAIMKKVSSDKDLTLRAEVIGQDEIAQIGMSFNNMLTAFQDLIDEVTGFVEQLATSAEELSAVTTQTNEGIQRQHNDIDQIAAAMNQMTATVEEVSRNTESTSEATKKAHRDAVNGHDIVSSAKDSIDKLAGGVTQASVVVNGLENDSADVGKILDVIRGIAEQTNLLALNAAIEAARAGEQGRGFAVVADEVRTLAKRTQDSIEEIETMIKSFQQGAHDAVTAMTEGKQMATHSVQQITEVSVSLDKINETVDSISQMSLLIANSANEQSFVTSEMSKSISDISGVAQETSQGAEQTSDASRELAKLAVNLREVTGRFSI